MFKKKTSKKVKSAGETPEDSSWIVEGIIAYLRSPTWKVPVYDFVDNQCGSFTNSEENSLEHTDVHKQYKILVEKLLGNYMKELGISENQFSAACSRSNSDIANMDSQFEFIWAADDFLIFKRLMIKHNIELQREALKMVAAGYALNSADTSESHLTDEDAAALTKMLKPSKMSISERKDRQKQEESDLRLALEFSRMEMERLNAIAEKENLLVEQAIRLSLASQQSPNAGKEKMPTSHVEDFKNPEELHNELTKPTSVPHTLPTAFAESSLDRPASYQPPPVEIQSQSLSVKDPVQAEDKSIGLDKKVERKTGASTVHSLPPLKSSKDISSAEAANAWLDKAMKGITDTSANSNSASSDETKHGSISEEELAKRKAYLQQQRDKLLAKKKKERNEELENFNDQKKDEIAIKPNVQMDPAEEKKLASRRAVAERLKREVINKK